MGLQLSRLEQRGARWGVAVVEGRAARNDSGVACIEGPNPDLGPDPNLDLDLNADPGCSGDQG